MMHPISESVNPEPDALECLLQQIEQSTSHYEALNLERGAAAEQIAAAYEQASVLLLLAQAAIEARDEAAIESGRRVECAISRTRQAYSVLSNPHKRAEYDRFVIVKTTGPLTDNRSTPVPPPLAMVAPPDANRFLTTASVEASDADLDASAATESRDDTEATHRSRQRFPLPAPAMVVGYDRKAGKWKECVDTMDASRTGITLSMRRRVRQGNVLYLTLALPKRLRSYGLDEPDYRVYARVQQVQPAKDGVRITEVEFVGEHPPVGYLEQPWATFQTQPWADNERRREPREKRSEPVLIEYFTESLHCLRQEAGHTEDVSASGLRVVVKGAPADFEFARVSYPERGIESYAVVCNRFFKNDGYERLCLELIDNCELAGRAVTRPELEARSPVGTTCASHHQPMRSKHILVADDDLPLRRVLGKILTSAGYDVTLVEDGQAAVKKAAEVKPDLVITDGLMPKMHGFLVCKTIKEMRPAPKVIMLTAVYTNLNYRFEARDRYGADELLTKPFEVANLLKCIEHHLDATPHALAG